MADPHISAEESYWQEFRRLGSDPLALEAVVQHAIQSAERDTAAKYEARIGKLEAALKWIADTPMQWTKSQNDIYWANVATAMAQSALDTLSKESK